MDNSHISVLLLLFGLTCAQYEVFIPAKGPRPSSQEGFDYSVSGSSNAGAKASTDSLYPNAPVPVAYPPYQGDPSYPYQQQEIYPLIIPSNGTNSDEPVYLAMLPMQMVYQQYYQDQEANYKPTSHDNVIYNPSVRYQNDPSFSSGPSYANDPSYFASSSYPKDPSDPAKSSDPNDPSDQNDPSYPATTSYPTTTPYPATPSYPSTQSYKNPPNDPDTPSRPVDPSYPSTTPYATNPTYPRTTPYPKEPTYTITSYPNTPAYPKGPASPNKSTYPETPKIPDTPSSSTDLDQSSNDNSFHGVKPPAKLYPCAGNSNGKKYGVQDVCFAYFECVNGESLYRQCEDHYRFDGAQCAPDVACLSACPDQMKPHPSDIYKFILGGTEMSCPYGTFFDYKICTCQSKNNLPKD